MSEILTSVVEEIQKKQIILQRTVGAVERSGGALERTGGAMDRTGVALQRTCVALQRTGGALDRTCVALQRTGGAIERSRHVLTLEPAAAHTAGLLIAPKEHLRLTGLYSYVRACVRHTGKYFSLHISW